MSIYAIDRSDSRNTKIVASNKIQLDTEIVVCVSKERTSEVDRLLYQQGLSEYWYETHDLGRYCNHSSTPNTRIVRVDDVLMIYAAKLILKGEELIVDYKQPYDCIGYVPKVDF